MGTGAPGAPPEPGGAWSAWALREEERVTRSGGDGHPGEQDASSSRSNMGHGLLVKNSSSESAAQPRRVAAWCWGRGPSPLSSRLGRVPAGQCPSSAGDRASDGRGGGALSRQQGAPHAPSFCLILWGSSLAPAATLDLAGAGVGDDSPVAHSPPGGRARVHSLRGRLFLAHSGARQSLGDHMGPPRGKNPSADPQLRAGRCQDRHGAAAWASAASLVAGTRPWAAPSSPRPRAAPTPWAGAGRCGLASTSPSALLSGK